MIRSPVNDICEAGVENVQPEEEQNASADKQPYIKRPLNPFILWTRTRVRAIASAKPMLRKPEICKQMAAEWNLLTMEQKQPFIDGAKWLKEQYKTHPDYIYQSRAGHVYPYLLWSQDRKREISLNNPKLPYSEIYKQLSAEWKLLTIEEKQPFIDESKRLWEQSIKDNPEYNRNLQRKPKSDMSNQCADTQSRNSPCQCECTYLEHKGSRQKLNPCDIVYSNASTSSLIQHSCSEPQNYDEESPLDLSVRKVR